MAQQGELIVIISPYFMAGLVYKERAAPIIHYMKDWEFEKIQEYCKKKKWSIKTEEEIYSDRTD